MLTVGVPREIKPREKRAALTPAEVQALHRLRVPVLVESGAGQASGFADEEYKRNGAEIVPDAKALYGMADLIQKVKEPLPAEYALLRPEHLLFCFLHLASPENCALVQALQEHRVTAVGYETLEVRGALPILAPMSRIAGGLAAAYAAWFLAKGKQASLSQLEEIAASYPRPPEALRSGRTVVFGGGSAGEAAARMSLALGGEVTVVEKNEERRRALDERFSILSPEVPSLAAALESAEVLIGCVHVRGERAPRVLEEAALEAASRKRKKILMDVAVDQGGNFPGTRSTTYDNPLYRDSCGNLRFAVSNIPSLAGRAASEALAQASFRYTAALAENPEEALRELPELAGAVNVRGGEVVLAAVRAAHQK